MGLFFALDFLYAGDGRCVAMSTCSCVIFGSNHTWYVLFMLCGLRQEGYTSRGSKKTIERTLALC